MAASLLLVFSIGAWADSFEGVVTRVSDGDTLWVRPAWGGAPRKIRLQGIDAPEICQVHGPESRDALAQRVLHQSVKVASSLRDDYQRALANVSDGGEDLGRWMVNRGHAWSYGFGRNPGPYAMEEARARKARLGLWREDAPERPRDFRKRHGSCGMDPPMGSSRAVRGRGVRDG